MYAKESCNVSVTQSQTIPAGIGERNSVGENSRKNRRYRNIKSKSLSGTEHTGHGNAGSASNHAPESSVVVDRVAIDCNSARRLRANKRARSDQGELFACRYDDAEVRAQLQSAHGQENRDHSAGVIGGAWRAIGGKTKNER